MIFFTIPLLSDLLTLGASSKSSDDRESLKIIENDVSRGAGRPASSAIVWENNFGKITF